MSQEEQEATAVTVSKRSTPLFKSKDKPARKGRHVKEKVQKHKQFDFFYTRTCFRYMNEYYKERYQHFFKGAATNKSLSQMSKQEIEENLVIFIDHLFGPELLQSPAMTETQRQ